MSTVEDAHLARQHNDANIIVFGARQVKAKDTELMLDEFLKTEFEGRRHQADNLS